MTSSTDNPTSARSANITDGVDQMRSQLGDTLQTALQMGNSTAHRLSDGVEQLRDSTSSALSQAATRANELSHRGLDLAREAAGHARDRASELRDGAAKRVQADPMKAMLTAAAVGAATALLVQWLRQPRRSH